MLEFNQELLDSRNKFMAAEIHKELSANPSRKHFIAFGCGKLQIYYFENCQKPFLAHFFGKNNIRDLLQKEYGYKVTEIKRSYEDELVSKSIKDQN